VDPLLFRDGRPFSDELGAQRADSLPVPYPGVVAGAVRTAIGTAAGWKWQDAGVPANALAISVHGPLVSMADDNPVVAAPADAVFYRKDNEKSNPLQCMCLRPAAVPDGSGCNIPDGMLPMRVTHEEKPEPGYRFWAWDNLMTWLGAAKGEGFDLVPDKFPNIGNPAVEERTHVKIGENGVAEDGMLFTTASVCPIELDKDRKTKERGWSYLVRVYHAQPLSGPMFLGGERRVAVADQADANDWPACPDDLKGKLAGSKAIRMMLVTPAIFTSGLMPGWAGGSPPGRNGPKMTLKGACVPRREAVSGWDYATRGPKAVRWLVPAGSVFLFEAEGDTSALASEGWLAPVSDNDQDRRDGYGLAVWGIWDTTGGNG